MNDELLWEPPGPGSWQLLADHYPRPVTAVSEPLMAVWYEASTIEMRDLGLPVKSSAWQPSTDSHTSRSPPMEVAAEAALPRRGS